MTSANPLKGSFRSHADVAVALDDLQQAIVDSVNDILVLTAKEDRSCNTPPPKKKKRNRTFHWTC